jgi:lipopolysaccharide transport system permease protein
MLIHVVLGRNIIVFAHNMITYFIAAIICGVSVSFQTLLVLPGFLLLLLNLSWMCLVIAIMCLRYRDFQQLVTIILQVVMFITPVFWPLSQLSGRAEIIVDVNILYHMIDLIRSPLLGKAPQLESYIVCIAAGFIGWLSAYWLLRSKRHRLVYWF